MSGIALIERLKSDGHDLPAIVITGSGAVPMAVKAMKAGAVDFIEKPVGHQDLLASIQRVLDQTRDTAALSKLRETAATCVATLTRRSTPDIGPSARRAPKQEYCRRSRHQPARGRQPSCGNHEEDGLEVFPGPDPHSDCCRLSHQDCRRCGSGVLANDKQMSTFRVQGGRLG
jgi:hypothetical protein